MLQYLQVGLGVYLTIKRRSGKEGVPQWKFKKDNFRLRPTLYECECMERRDGFVATMVR